MRGKPNPDTVDPRHRLRWARRANEQHLSRGGPIINEPTVQELEDWERQALRAHLEELRRQPNHPMSYTWGIVSIWGEELPLDARVCDWLDERPHPPGWRILQRPLNRR